MNILTVENVFDRVINLLGKTPDHADFSKFTENLNETPISNGNGAYTFRQSGIIMLAELDGTFGAIIFSIRSSFYDLILYNFFEPPWDDYNFSGNLPGGIKAGDRLEVVHRKLSSFKWRVLDEYHADGTIAYKEEYDFPTFFLQILFDEERRVTGVTVSNFSFGPKKKIV